MTAPVAVLVHGLWHGAWCWDAVRAALIGRGVDSVAATRAVLDARGRPVVLVGHSYGGAVVTAAGVHPPVHELVYVAAHQLDEGESVNRTRYAELPGTRLGEALPVSGDTVDLDPVIGPRLLYGEAPTAVAVAATARLRPVHRSVFRGCRSRSPGGRCPRPTPSARRTRSCTPSGSAPWPPVPPGWWSGRAVTAPR